MMEGWLAWGRLYMCLVGVSCTRLHGAAVEDKGQEQLVGRR